MRSWWLSQHRPNLSGHSSGLSQTMPHPDPCVFILVHRAWSPTWHLHFSPVGSVWILKPSFLPLWTPEAEGNEYHLGAASHQQGQVLGPPRALCLQWDKSTMFSALAASGKPQDSAPAAHRELPSWWASLLTLLPTPLQGFLPFANKLLAHESSH